MTQPDTFVLMQENLARKLGWRFDAGYWASNKCEMTYSNVAGVLYHELVETRRRLEESEGVVRRTSSLLTALFFLAVLVGTITVTLLSL